MTKSMTSVIACCFDAQGRHRLVNLGRDSGLEVAVIDGGHGGAGRCLVDVRICTTARPLLRERTDGDGGDGARSGAAVTVW